MNSVTLLSPARDVEVAKAAIQAGADAVYIGAPKFGAREAAGNSLEDLAKLTDYAKLYGVQILVTLNTLLKPDEVSEALEIAKQLHAIGIYALIVQDLAFAELLFRELPELRLHASTQCDNRTPEQVAQLHDMRFKRVVLARELSIDEIRAIHKAVPDIELEAFVHGALCVSYSGRCFMSEVLLNRSANRGCCAQMCRMRYDLLDENGNEIIDDNGEPVHQRYLLSLQDLDRSAYIAELIDAGVTTFKIEGRLKSADYVTNITAYYRNLLDSGFVTPTHVYSRTFTPNPEKTFHRGATDYFMHGRTQPLTNWHTPKSTGEYIGEVLDVRGKTLRVKLMPNVVLHNGDGLTIGDEGFSVNGIDGNLIYVNKLVSPSVKSGKLYRNLDTEFIRTLKSERRIPVDIRLSETAAGFCLQIGDKQREFVYPKEPARDTDKALATIKAQLTKLGDTPYIARDVQITCAPYFIPISVLNQWRRETVK